jgi:hypothetical protein
MVTLMSRTLEALMSWASFSMSVVSHWPSDWQAWPISDMMSSMDKPPILTVSGETER